MSFNYDNIKDWVRNEADSIVGEPFEIIVWLEMLLEAVQEVLDEKRGKGEA